MEKVKLENSRGKELVGNYWSADSEAGIVMCHGFTGSKEQYGKFTKVGEELHSAGFNVLAFDFSGCGESEDDSIALEKEVEDLNSAIGFLQSRGIDRLSLFSLSQGGWIALEAYKERREELSCLVLLAPLTEALPNYRERKYSEKQRRQLQEDGYIILRKEKGKRNKYEIPEKLIHKKETLNQDKLLEGIDCPALFIHGTKDDSVPIEQSKKAVNKLDSAELVKIEDNHYWEESVSEVAQNSVSYFKKHLKV